MPQKNQLDISQVCHVVRRFVKEEWGGTESVVYNLASQYESKNISSPILSTNMLSSSSQESMGAVDVRRFPYVFPWLGLSAVAKKQLELKGGSPLSLSLLRYLKKLTAVSIIHTHTEHRLGGIARTVARWKKIPYVVSLHGGCLTLPEEQIEVMKKPFENKFEWGKIFGALLGSRKVLQDADAIICVGRDEFGLMKKRFPNKEVVYQPNGVSSKFFENGKGDDFREKYGVAGSTEVFLCVSRIDQQKNQLLLLEAFADYQQKKSDSQLILIGPITIQTYHQDLLDRAQELGVIDKLLILPGFKPDDVMLANAYTAADTFVLPSRHEPFGIVILEAWAAGTPVIAANVGGISGFSEHGKDILLFKDNDKEDLLQCMTQVSENKDLASKLKENATVKVKNYDWSNIAEQTLDLYRRLIKNKMKK
ncbi:MAG: glycosyltransferase family 4 protein [Lentisphaeraceae bacterium]|nr:glycosyltransferase family 4 protein [Lentisphaeraceae bacterium]